MLKKFLIFFSLFLSGPLLADDCLVYKNIPKIIVNEPDYTIEIVQPNTPMDLWHGNVIATMVDNYDLITDVKPVKDGFCVVLKTVNSLFGYNDFRVNIDIHHTPNGCAYNAILEHEKKHINTYLEIIQEFKGDLQQSIFNAADSVMPVFIKSKQDVLLAVDKMNNELQSHPELVLVKQKIKAAEEIKNKNIDKSNYNTDELKKCFDLIKD